MERVTIRVIRHATSWIRNNLKLQDRLPEIKSFRIPGYVSSSNTCGLPHGLIVTAASRPVKGRKQLGSVRFLLRSNARSAKCAGDWGSTIHFDCFLFDQRFLRMAAPVGELWQHSSGKRRCSRVLENAESPSKCIRA